VSCIKRLEQAPRFYSNPYRGKTYNVSEFHYALTPLTFGQITIPPAKVKIIYHSTSKWNPYSRSSSTQTQQVELSSAALKMDIKPAVSSLDKWQPLQQLKVRGQVDRTSGLNIGEPVSLSLMVEGGIARGEQLPAPILKVDEADFKVYPENTLIEETLAKDNRYLGGRRVETYTLIPQRGGLLKLPPIQIPWWDLKRHQATRAEWRGENLLIKGGGIATAEDEQQARSAAASGSLSWMWLVLSNFVFLAIGWWIGAGRPGKEIMQEKALQTWHWLLLGLRWFWQRSAALRNKFPQDSFREAGENLHRYATAPVTYLPQRIYQLSLFAPLRSFRFLRAIEAETEAKALAAQLMRFSHETTGTALLTPLPVIARSLAATYPSLNKTRLLQLCQSLDQACFDRPAAFDARQWKMECRRVFQYLPLYKPKPHCPDDNRLPGLNPVAGCVLRST
ncbi:BatD family protein, partial [Candidatus Venteria ishoeyi]|uniref:BatD family protein n=1 Tax=Candidatus Venteria ishoeyi TaxID=1899563 RepID=UPI0011B0DE2D